MLLIIDGNNIAYRAFHTPQNDLCTKAGEPTGILMGVLNSIKYYLDTFPETTKVIVPFDGGKSRWRMELYPEYKGNRSYGDDPVEKAKFEALFHQIDMLVEFLPKIGIQALKLPGVEADDIVATVCKMVDGEKMIVTSDKDMLQLIDDNTTVYNPNKKKVISKLNFFEEYGIPLHAYIGFKAMLGDPSDNINAIPGLGEKTITKIVNEFGSVDNILKSTGADRAKLMKSARTKRIFEPQNLQVLARNNKLMNFDYIQLTEEEYGIIRTKLAEMLEVDSQAFKDFLIRWQFTSILENYTAWILALKSLGEDY